MELELGVELVFWDSWLRTADRTVEKLHRVTIVSKGRKYYTATTKGGKIYKIDPQSLCSTGEYPIRFYPNEEAILRQLWCETHSNRIADAVRRQPYEILQKVADLIGYSDKGGI